MRVSNVLISVFITGACTLGVSAQAPFKYLPQAAKGTKAIPYVVNPKLPLAVQVKIATPVVRANVTPVRPGGAQAVTSNTAAGLRPQAVQALQRTVAAKTVASARQAAKAPVRKPIISEETIASSSVMELFDMIYPTWKEETLCSAGITDPQQATQMIEGISFIVSNKLDYRTRSFYNQEGILNISYLTSGGERKLWPYNLEVTAIKSLKAVQRDSHLSLLTWLNSPDRQKDYQLARTVLRKAQAKGYKIPTVPLLEDLLARWDRKVLNELSAQISQLEEFAKAHNGRLPLAHADERSDFQVREGAANRVRFLRLHGLQDHPLVRRYGQLNEVSIRQRNEEKRQEWQARAEKRQQEAQAQKQARAEQRLKDAQARQARLQQEEQMELEIRQSIKEYEQREFEKFLLQEREWKEEMAEARQHAEALAKFDKETETNAAKAARMAEKRLFMEGDVTTEDFVIKLLNFYKPMNPSEDSFNMMGNSPAKWADKLQKFIDKYHRAPMRFSQITSQQMLNEHRLAKAVFGLTDRLPETDPDKQRIDQLLASVGMDKESRIQKLREHRRQASQKGRQAKSKKTAQAWLAIIEPWVIEHQRWPARSAEQEERMYRGADYVMRSYPDDPSSMRLKALKEKYGRN